MIEVDRLMMNQLHVPIEIMMENAGLWFARFASKYAALGGKDSDTIYQVISGPGNNGGGGLVAARRLAGWGQSVEVYIPKKVDTLSSTAKSQLERLNGMDVPVNEIVPNKARANSLLLDSYLGYGYTKRQDTISDEVFEYLSKHPFVVSLDVPSGLDSNTGEGIVNFKPKATLTIAFVKKGLLLADPSSIGDLFVCDIGVPFDIYESKLGIEWIKPLDPLCLLELGSAFKAESYIEVKIESKGNHVGWCPVF